MATSILRVPITFPPDRFGGKLLSAMCVPDLRGTQGTFTEFREPGADGTAEAATHHRRRAPRLERDGPTAGPASCPGPTRPTGRVR